MLPTARQVRRESTKKQIAIIVAAVAATVAALFVADYLVDYFDVEMYWINVGTKIAIVIGFVAFAVTRSYVRGWLGFVSVTQWRTIAEDSEPAPANPHVHALVILLTCAISLTIQEYVGGADRYETWFPYDGSDYWELKGFVWWTSWRVFGYVVLPVAALAIFLPGERIGSYNLSARGFFRHLWIYAVMFVAFSPIVVVASLSDSFRDTYPFYRMANRSHVDLWSWELLYVVQFISLEFFFRGFLLQGLRRVFGANAVFVMIVPYCMIHYGKPVTETFGAIGAGLVLGTLAMRTRSIWGGVLIHVGVAMTMDILALQGCPPIGSDRYCHP